MYLANMAPELFPGATFAIAHCNFSLRGEESDADMEFVCNWAGHHSMPVFVKTFQTMEYAQSTGQSIEMAARELRYNWFASLVQEHSFDALAVAHNANDNAETFILNLSRGTGSKGLRGMSKDSVRMVNGVELRILRPLLETPRKDIEQWMRSHFMSWREDRSNSDTIYKRNLIRHEILPKLQELNPSFLRTLERVMEHIEQVDNIASGYYEQHPVSNVDQLLELEHWEYVLWRMVEPYSLSYETLEKLCALLRRYKEEPRGTVTLGSKKFESAKGTLSIYRKKFIFTPKDHE